MDPQDVISVSSGSVRPAVVVLLAAVGEGISISLMVK